MSSSRRNGDNKNGKSRGTKRPITATKTATTSDDAMDGSPPHQRRQQPQRLRLRKNAPSNITTTTTTTAAAPRLPPPPRKRKRPPPPPPPPNSLIQLLQSDKKVLAYFTSLQANLEADVQIWKERSQHYQEQCHVLEEELAQLKQKPSSHQNGTTNRRRTYQQKSPPVDSLLLADEKKEYHQSNSNDDDDEDDEKMEEEEDNNYEMEEQIVDDVLLHPPGPNNGKRHHVTIASAATTTTAVAALPQTTTITKPPPNAVAADKIDDDARPVDDSMFMLSSSEDNDDDDDGGDDDEKEEDSDLDAKPSSRKHPPITSALYSSDDEEEEEEEEEDNGTFLRPMVAKKNHGRIGTRRDDRATNKKSNAFQRSVLSSDEDDEEDNAIFFDNWKATPHSVARRRRNSPTNKKALTASRNENVSDESEGVEKEEDQMDALSAPLLQPQVYSSLLEAQRCLNRLGVSLVEPIEESEGGDYEQERQQQQPQQLHPNVPTINSLPTTTVTTTITPIADVATNALQEQDKALVTPNHGSNQPPKVIRYQRRSDHDVLSDLLQAIRALTRLLGTFSDLLGDNKEAYSPFATTCMIPSFVWKRRTASASSSCDDTNDDASAPVTTTATRTHPVWEARWCALRALLTMDAYGDAIKSDEEWTKMRSFSSTHSPGNDDEVLFVGMRDRKGLVDVLLSSLHGEISQTWATTDRAARRLQSDLLHLQDSQDEQAQEEADEDETIISQAGEAKQQRQSASQGVNGLTQQSLIRRSALLERCVMAQLAIALYLGRGDPTMAFRLVVEYVLSTTPSLALEDYPKYSPVLSLCVLEAMLASHTIMTTMTTGQDADQSWFSSYLQRSESRTSRLVQVLSLVIHATAQIWKDRMVVGSEVDDNDDGRRIAAIAQVELASYQRLLDSESDWLGEGNHETLANYRDEADQLSDQLFLSLMKTTVDEEDKEELPMAVTLALVFQGSNDSTYTRLRDATSMDNEIEFSFKLFWTSAMAMRQLSVRSIDWLQQQVGRPAPVAELSKQLVLRWIADWSIRQLKSAKQQSAVYAIVLTALRCCSEAADGESTLKVLCSYILNRSSSQSRWEWQNQDLLQIVRCGETPTVRVINLQRRCDRLDAFVAQAQQHHVRVVKAVVQWDVGQETKRDAWDYYCGSHAFDGFGRKVEVDKRLSDLLYPKQLNALVESSWQPSHLKAFDTDARNDEEYVDISPSERACALSHIASWEGVRRTLAQGKAEPESIRQNPLHLVRLFCTSGFARGAPLLHSNQHMSPSPVCVVLEDDAILVDRFVDRLEAVLDELPRDFHFCSIGYSRPKTAPMVKYSLHVGIPTCLWYLTGYILSAEGAEYLLGSLPVRGPVDSWIGFQLIRANWDNVLGQALGVGVHSKPSTESPSRKDLAAILKFRAFAAVVPLCSQKVASSTSSAAAMATTNRRRWRQRDTDITFSGN